MGFPVIIDNMMNLELLFEATKLSGDSIYHTMAVSHANTTMKNHYRQDNSCYHVLVYDTINGSVKQKITHQGIADESDWARGQGWGIYGYTMCYRYTQDAKYLAQAEKAANFMFNHPNMPEDGIPYWDLKSPKIPNEPRDASAAAVIASGLYELYGYTNNILYKEKADNIIAVLETEDYMLDSAFDARLF